MSDARSIVGMPVRVRWGRLLSVVDAAEYLGVSVNTLGTLGIPARRNRAAHSL